VNTEHPLDPRYLRFQGIVIATTVLAGFVFGYAWVLPALALVMAAAGIGGRPANVVYFVYDIAVAPRLSPHGADEDAGLVRFSIVLAAVVLSASTALLALGLGGIAWVLALILAAIEAVSAVAAIPLGRFIYERFPRRGR